MKILAFYGSTRKRGNTKIMLDTFLAEFPTAEIEIIDAYRYTYENCKDCRYCWKKRGCSIKDQVTENLYPKIDAADLVVFASPIYFHSITGGLKSLIDRFQTYWAQHMRGDRPENQGKQGVILLNGGAPSFPQQFLGAELVLNGVLHDINASIVGAVHAHTTDTNPVADNQKVLEDIKKIARSLQLNEGSPR